MTERELEAGEVAQMPVRQFKKDIYIHSILCSFSDHQMAWIIQQVGLNKAESFVGYLRDLVEKDRAAKQAAPKELQRVRFSSQPPTDELP